MNKTAMNVSSYPRHEAESYLRNPSNPPTIHVKINGSRRRLFINRSDGTIGIIAKGKQKKGHVFSAWDSIEKVLYPDMEEDNVKLVGKYQRLAKGAAFSNDWLRRIAKADPSQSLYDNRITTGNAIDGKCIWLTTLAKYCGEGPLEQFRRAVKGCSHFSFRFDHCGYDGTLWCEPRENGEVMAGFSKEYRRCANGYYYLLINDDTLIGYDVD